MLLGLNQPKDLNGNILQTCKMNQFELPLNEDTSKKQQSNHLNKLVQKQQQASLAKYNRSKTPQQYYQQAQNSMASQRSNVVGSNGQVYQGGASQNEFAGMGTDLQSMRNVLSMIEQDEYKPQVVLFDSAAQNGRNDIGAADFKNDQRLDQSVILSNEIVLKQHNLHQQRMDLKTQQNPTRGNASRIYSQNQKILSAQQLTNSAKDLHKEQQQDSQGVQAKGKQASLTIDRQEIPKEPTDTQTLRLKSHGDNQSQRSKIVYQYDSSKNMTKLMKPHEKQPLETSTTEQQIKNNAILSGLMVSKDTNQFLQSRYGDKSNPNNNQCLRGITLSQEEQSYDEMMQDYNYKQDIYIMQTKDEILKLPEGQGYTQEDFTKLTQVHEEKSKNQKRKPSYQKQFQMFDMNSPKSNLKYTYSKFQNQAINQTGKNKTKSTLKGKYITGGAKCVQSPQSTKNQLRINFKNVLANTEERPMETERTHTHQIQQQLNLSQYNHKQLDEQQILTTFRNQYKSSERIYNHKILSQNDQAIQKSNRANPNPTQSVETNLNSTKNQHPQRSQENMLQIKKIVLKDKSEEIYQHPEQKQLNSKKQIVLHSSKPNDQPQNVRTTNMSMQNEYQVNYQNQENILLQDGTNVSTCENNQQQPNNLDFEDSHIVNTQPIQQHQKQSDECQVPDSSRLLQEDSISKVIQGDGEHQPVYLKLQSLETEQSQGKQINVQNVDEANYQMGRNPNTREQQQQKPQPICVLKNSQIIDITTNIQSQQQQQQSNEYDVSKDNILENHMKKESGGDETGSIPKTQKINIQKLDIKQHVQTSQKGNDSQQNNNHNLSLDYSPHVGTRTKDENKNQTDKTLTMSQRRTIFQKNPGFTSDSVSSSVYHQTKNQNTDNEGTQQKIQENEFISSNPENKIMITTTNGHSSLIGIEGIVLQHQGATTMDPPFYNYLMRHQAIPPKTSSISKRRNSPIINSNIESEYSQKRQLLTSHQAYRPNKVRQNDTQMHYDQIQENIKENKKQLNKLLTKGKQSSYSNMYKNIKSTFQKTQHDKNKNYIQLSKHRIQQSELQQNADIKAATGQNFYNNGQNLPAQGDLMNDSFHQTNSLNQNTQTQINLQESQKHFINETGLNVVTQGLTPGEFNNTLLQSGQLSPKLHKQGLENNQSILKNEELVSHSPSNIIAGGTDLKSLRLKQKPFEKDNPLLITTITSPTSINKKQQGLTEALSDNLSNNDQDANTEGRFSPSKPITNHLHTHNQVFLNSTRFNPKKLNFLTCGASLNLNTNLGNQTFSQFVQDMNPSYLLDNEAIISSLSKQYNIQQELLEKELQLQKKIEAADKSNNHELLLNVQGQSYSYQRTSQLVELRELERRRMEADMILKRMIQEEKQKYQATLLQGYGPDTGHQSYKGANDIYQEDLEQDLSQINPSDLKEMPKHEVMKVHVYKDEGSNHLLDLAKKQKSALHRGQGKREFGNDPKNLDLPVTGISRQSQLKSDGYEYDSTLNKQNLSSKSITKKQGMPADTLRNIGTDQTNVDLFQINSVNKQSNSKFNKNIKRNSMTHFGMHDKEFNQKLDIFLQKPEDQSKVASPSQIQINQHNKAMTQNMFTQIQIQKLNDSAAIHQYQTQQLIQLQKQKSNPSGVCGNIILGATLDQNTSKQNNYQKKQFFAKRARNSIGAIVTNQTPKVADQTIPRNTNPIMGKLYSRVLQHTQGQSQNKTGRVNQVQSSSIKAQSNQLIIQGIK